MKGNKGPFERKNKGFEHSGTLLAHTRKVFFFSYCPKRFTRQAIEPQTLTLTYFCPPHQMSFHFQP